MRRTLNCLFFVFVTLILVGCNRSTEEPTPTATTAPVSFPLKAPSSTLPTPVPISQAPTPLPFPLPTITPTLVPVVQPTSIFYSIYNAADGSQIVVTPIPSAPTIACLPKEDVFECYDSLLKLNFSYPAFMRPILYTQFSDGGYSGYAYDYWFEKRESFAGGRSRDHSEGRGRILTDQNGLDGRKAAEICNAYGATICQEFGPSIILLLMLPRSETLCIPGGVNAEIPFSFLILDLPDHPLINGFAIGAFLIPPELAEDFKEEWYDGDLSCEPSTLTTIGEASDRLRQDLEAGTADPEIQQRYDAMFALAESIQSPYIATSP